MWWSPCEWKNKDIKIWSDAQDKFAVVYSRTEKVLDDIRQKSFSVVIPIYESINNTMKNEENDFIRLYWQNHERHISFLHWLEEYDSKVETSVRVIDAQSLWQSNTNQMTLDGN